MTVDAYDAVFFNVMERKDSPAYLRHAVKRGVTRERGMVPPENPTEESLMMIGLNGTLEDVLRLSGSVACTWAA
jgi:hypothetical protein